MTLRLASLCVTVVVLTGSAGPAPRLACAGDPPPLKGEVTELTPDARAAAQKHVDAIVAGTDVAKAVKELLVMGPAVWPVLDNAIRLSPPEDARPYLNYLKALLLKKTDPDFEILRDGIRRKTLTNNVAMIRSLCLDFRIGRPDPAKPGKRLPLAVKPTKNAQGAMVYKCPDNTITIVFGSDGDAKAPDAGDVEFSDDAGFVAVIGGRAVPAQGSSGHGANVTLHARQGFAFAWAGDGADGVAPGGQGGDGGAADAKGPAGQFSHSGNGGKGAPG